VIGEPFLSVTNINGFAFSPDMRLLVATAVNGRLEAWDIASQQTATNFAAHAGTAPVFDLVFTSDGKKLVTFGAENVAKEWDTTSWKKTGEWPLEPKTEAFAISSVDGLLAAATGSGQVELIPSRDPDKRRRFTGQDRIVSLKFSPDGRTLAAASESGTVELWATESLTRKALLRGILLGYHSVTVSPDGERVAAGSNGQEAIKLWDLASHEEVATLAGHGSFFTDASFSPDGNTIGARNWNGVIHFWTAPSWKRIEMEEKARHGGAQ